jgi:hypothetical protein
LQGIEVVHGIERVHIVAEPFVSDLKSHMSDAVLVAAVSKYLGAWALLLPLALKGHEV